MLKYVAPCAVALVIAARPVHAQETLQLAYDSAAVAWEDGDYPAALRTFARILDAPRGDAWLRDIALITGEFYKTTELAPDGTNPVWSPDGRYVSYETPSDEGEGTHVLDIGDGGRRIAELPGTRITFSASGVEAAYLAIEDKAGRIRARAAIMSAARERTRAAFEQRRLALAEVDARFARVRVRNLLTGEDRLLPTRGLAVFELTYAGDSLYALAAHGDAIDAVDLYFIAPSTAPRRLTSDGGFKSGLFAPQVGEHLVYAVNRSSVAICDRATGESEIVPGLVPVVSADGSTIAFLRIVAGGMSVHVMRPGGAPQEIVRLPYLIEDLALSPNGDRVVFQAMPREDSELMIVNVDGSNRRQLTWEIQHDLFPRFLDSETILAVKGEGRHRRSYLFDASTGAMTRFFHNNTIRTVAPEYEWVASPDGERVLIVAERDGDTISPERGVYLVDRTRELTKRDVLERIQVSLAAEMGLRERGQVMFEPIRAAVEEAVADVSTTRIYEYEVELFAFESKYITQPGNAFAIEYLFERLEAFGYEPELQWFDPRPGVRTANVIATLPGTVDPDLIYVVSSHFDSVERGPGADDNTSGTSALLEAARVLADRPQAATIKFAFFTGEEAGLLGSREFVRRAIEAGDQIVGALNNDMVGFANDQRLDNTIRYSNAGIRDAQHAAAFLFTDLITYDAKYYKSTDAAAYFEAYGDIVGGIGSYPILANPHYHQTHDVLETMNHQLIAEVSKTTVATIQLLASSPSRLTDLTVRRSGGRLVATWKVAVESSIDHYVVSVSDDGDLREVHEPRIVLSDVTPGAVIQVKAVDRDGMQSWDWARVVVP